MIRCVGLGTGWCSPEPKRGTMHEGATLFLGAGFLVSALGWVWYAHRARRRLDRIGRSLDALSEGHPSEAALAIVQADSGLAGLLESLGRVCAFQESLLHRIVHEEFSLRTMLSSMEEGVLVVQLLYYQ